LCLRLKSFSYAWLSRWLIDLLLEAQEAQLHTEILLSHRPVIVPVPLHWMKRIQRGYNQSDALAERLARRLKLPFTRALKRIKSTAPLAGASRNERMDRVKDAFRSKTELKGRTVFLVDDILTSGATCGAAARALKKAGAKRVVVVVIARTDRIR
jgi:ComF family protein